MYVVGDIAYADNPTPILTVISVRHIAEYVLRVKFSTGEIKDVDCVPLLAGKVFEPLKNPNIFRQVYVDYGTLVWQEGQIDIAPEWLFENGVSI